MLLTLKVNLLSLLLSLFFHVLEKIGTTMGYRSVKSDVALGAGEALTYDVCIRLFADHVHSATSSPPGITDPMFWVIRSLVSDMVLKAATPLVDAPSPSPSPQRTQMKAEKPSLIVNLDELQAKKCYVLLPELQQRKYIPYPKGVMSEAKSQKRQRIIIRAVLRAVLIPIIIHSLAHTVSSVTTHEFLDGILLQ